MSRPPASPASHARLEAEPNVTPMIDVLLVLLIVFMVMLPLMQEQLPVQLPAPARDAGPANATPLVLAVAPGPTYSLNRQPIAAADLARSIARTFAARPDKILYVAGDSGVTYQQVVTAMDVAKGAGVRVLAIAPGRTTARGHQPMTGRR
jgi:biopolymer transport protein TolR